MNEDTLIDITEKILSASRNHDLWDNEQAEKLVAGILSLVPGSRSNWDGPNIENWASITEQDGTGVALVCAYIPIVVVRTDLITPLTDKIPGDIVAIIPLQSGVEAYLCDFAVLQDAFADFILKEDDYAIDGRMKPFFISDLYVDTVV